MVRNANPSTNTSVIDRLLEDSAEMKMFRQAQKVGNFVEIPYFSQMFPAYKSALNAYHSKDVMVPSVNVSNHGISIMTET